MVESNVHVRNRRGKSYNHPTKIHRVESKMVTESVLISVHTNYVNVYIAFGIFVYMYDITYIFQMNFPNIPVHLRNVF